MATVKGLSGALIPQPWEVVKEFDFASHIGTHTFSDGVAYSWEDTDWLCRNLATHGTSIEFINGVGLKILVNGADAGAYANWYVGYMNCPLLETTVTDILPDYDASDTLCFQVLLTGSTGGSYTPADGAYQGNFLILKDDGYGTFGGPTTTSNWIGVGMYANGDADHTVAYCRNGGLTGCPGGIGCPITSVETSGKRFPSFYEQVFFPACTSICSAATGEITTFPPPLTTTEFHVSSHRQETYSYQISNMPGGTSTAAPSYDLRPANVRVALSSRVYTGAPPSTMNFTTIFSKLRVLRRPRHD